MQSGLLAEFAVLHYLQSVGSILLILISVVIALLTLGTSKGNSCSHGKHLQKNYTLLGALSFYHSAIAMSNKNKHKKSVFENISISAPENLS